MLAQVWKVDNVLVIGAQGHVHLQAFQIFWSSNPWEAPIENSLALRAGGSSKKNIVVDAFCAELAAIFTLPLYGSHAVEFASAKYNWNKPLFSFINEIETSKVITFLLAWFKILQNHGFIVCDKVRSR